MFEGLDLHEIYSLVLGWITYLILIALAILLFIKSGKSIKFQEKLLKFSKKNKSLLIHLSLAVFILSLVAFGIMSYMISGLDTSTRAVSPQKLVIIEIDDYWNLEDTGEYFDKYGYNMETFRAVSDIIDKHNFVATLGVSPHIFIEETRETFDLKDDPIMISYLKELQDGGYELAMHGYSHCRNKYYCPKYEEVYFNVMQGKTEIEQLFGRRLITYLPPGNQWTTEQYENVKDAGFKFIANTHVPVAYYDEDVIITPKGYDPIYHYDWYGLDFRHTDYVEWIDAYEESDFFILQLHCNTFDTQEKLDDLDNFLAHLKENNVKVTTYSEAYALLIKDRQFSPLPKQF
jgi:predicted deacetylase